jgi:hypothetical protein
MIMMEKVYCGCSWASNHFWYFNNSGTSGGEPSSVERSSGKEIYEGVLVKLGSVTVDSFPDDCLTLEV